MMGILKSYVKEKAQSIVNDLPDWSNCKFDKVVDTTAYSKRRAFIDDKFTNLIVDKEVDVNADEKKISDQPKTIKKDDAKPAKKDDATETRKQDSSHFDFDPSDKNQQLFDKDTGELYGDSINELPPSMLAEQAIVTQANNKTEQSNPNVSVNNSADKAEPVTYEEQQENVAKDQEVATKKDNNTVSLPSRKQYRQIINKQNQEKSKEFSKKENSKTSKLRKKSETSTSFSDDLISLENCIPPEEEEDDFVPSYEPKSTVVEPSNQPSAPKKRENYKPTNEDKKVLDQYGKWLNEGWKDYIS